jgi:hypothetical protein
LKVLTAGFNRRLGNLSGWEGGHACQFAHKVSRPSSAFQQLSATLLTYIKNSFANKLTFLSQDLRICLDSVCAFLWLAIIKIEDKLFGYSCTYYLPGPMTLLIAFSNSARWRI